MLIKIKILLICSLLSCEILFAGELDSLMKTGIEFYSHGEYKEANLTFSKVILLAKKENNKKELANAYNNIGNICSKTGESTKALENYQASIKVAEQIHDKKSIAKTTKNIGSLYSEQKDFNTALKYYETAYSLAVEISDSLLIADCLNNQGVVYEQQLKYEKAVEVYTQALNIYSLKGDEYKISIALNNLAIVYKYLKIYPQSIRFYEAALKLSEKSGDKFMIAANLNNLGNVYVLTGDYSRSLSLCSLALKKAIEINAVEIIIEAYDGISIAYEHLHKYPEAIKYRKLYEEEKFKFINTERSVQLAEIKTKYESDKQLNEITFLKQNEIIKNLALRQQEIQIQKRNNLLGYSALLFFIVIAAGITWMKSNRIKNKISGILAIKEAEEIERIRISKDIHDELGSGLTKISFISEFILKNTVESAPVNNKITSIADTAKNLIENMRDLIWALNPENTTLDNLLSRIREYSSDYLEEFPISLINDFPDTIKDVPINKESHRNIFLAVKEILNNIVKHSKATQVTLKVNINTENLSISMKDNGEGFKPDIATTGNGLKNMNQRIYAIGGKLEITSSKEGGSFLEISVPLANIIHV